MAQIKQIGPGRKTTGTVDGIVYVTRKGVTYARAVPVMPERVFKTPAALKRQAIFKMVQMHMKFHLRTLKQTFTPKGNGTVSNRYYAENGKHLTKALDSLANQWVAGEVVTLTDIEAAIAAYAAEHPQSIVIAARSGYGKVYLTGAWPATITLHASGGDSTVIIIVAENGTTTTFNPDGSTVVVSGSNDPGSNGSGSNSSGSNSSGSNDSGTGGTSGTSDAVATPVISGTTPFAESTSATISCTTAGASIYYTVDGSTPTSASTAYTEAIALTDTTTVKAVAVKDGVSRSVTTKVFTKGSGGGDDPLSD